jgi:hypothetical protein
MSMAFKAMPGTTSNTLDSAETIAPAPAETLKKQFLTGLVKYIPVTFCRHWVDSTNPSVTNDRRNAETFP